MTTLQLDLQPGLPAVAGVIAVLHARAARLERLSYRIGDGLGRLEIGVGQEQAERLGAQLARRVDVLGVRVGTRA